MERAPGGVRGGRLQHFSHRRVGPLAVVPCPCNHRAQATPSVAAFRIGGRARFDHTSCRLRDYVMSSRPLRPRVAVCILCLVETSSRPHPNGRRGHIQFGKRNGRCTNTLHTHGSRRPAGVDASREPLVRDAKQRLTVTTVMGETADFSSAHCPHSAISLPRSAAGVQIPS